MTHSNIQMTMVTYLSISTVLFFGQTMLLLKYLILRGKMSIVVHALHHMSSFI